MNLLEQNIEKIEKAVQERKVLAFKKLLNQFLKSHPSESLVFRICDWYRRLGLFREGFLYLSPSEPLQGRVASDSIEGRRLLWAARFLNLLGCGDYAIQLLASLEFNSSEANRIAGSIYLAQYEFHKAYQHYQRMIELESAPEHYSARIGTLGFADALAGLGRIDEALALAGNVFQTSNEPILRAIALTAQGEYYVKSGDIDLAVRVLEKARTGFSVDDLSPDHALFKKWYGFAIAKQGGRLLEANACLDEAYRLLALPGIRREAAFHVLCLKAELGLLSSETIQKIQHFPGISPGFRKEMGGAQTRVSVGDESARLTLYFQRNELEDRGVARYGLSMAQRLMAILMLSYDFGIEISRVYGLLWPNQAYSLSLVEKRLHVLLHQIRKSGGVIDLAQGMLRLSKYPHEIRVIWEPSASTPMFIDKVPYFRRRELEKYYGLSKTQANSLIAEWISAGWVRIESRGRESHYRRMRIIP